MDKENKVILYKDEEGKVSVNTRFADEDVWLTQAQLAEIYQTTQQNVSLHLQGIYGDKELDDDERTHKKYLLVRQEGKRKVQREIEHYNLDVIIPWLSCAVAYSSPLPSMGYTTLTRVYPKGIHDG